MFILVVIVPLALLYTLRAGVGGVCSYESVAHMYTFHSHAHAFTNHTIYYSKVHSI